MSSRNDKSISLSSETPYVKGGRFLAIPADINQNFTPCPVKVDALDGYQAWLISVQSDLSYPSDEELFLIEFRDEFVLTHRTRITQRKGGRILVAAPSLTEREKSQLAPSTGRHDYRVNVNVPIQLRFLSEKPGELLRNAKLSDLSRGGMSFFTEDVGVYNEGDLINLQIVSWEYPVNIDAVVRRIVDHEGQEQVAIRFKDDLNVRQREMISAFIIQVQRRDALSRSLPSEE